ncbi:MAG: lysoplasmalogenase [Clostridia bacterium]|nr:lysoplasmalogenase [Clostridia bacterium]
MKKSQKIINILLAVAILAGDVVYIINSHIVAKSITSLLFVALGAVNLFFAIKEKTPIKKFCIIMVVGLFFAMLGDIVLEIEFIVGALLFATGHLFYFAAYCTLQKFSIKNLIPSVCIFIPATLLIVLAPIFDFGGLLMEFVCIFYALIISVMVGKSISNYIKEKSLFNLIIMIGSILFMFSDIMLLFNVFASVPRIFGILCLSTYYPAEILLALSISLTNKK